MRKIIPAVLATALLAAGAAPAAAEIPGPPLDPVHYDGGGGCPPPEEGYPCDPMPATLEVDKTYPKRLADWATDLLP